MSTGDRRNQQWRDQLELMESLRDWLLEAECDNGTPVMTVEQAVALRLRVDRAIERLR